MSNPNHSGPARRCHNCSEPVTSAGRRTVDGVYFCKRRACQTERHKRRAEIAAVYDDRPWAPVICANPACAAPLKPRKIRLSDSPLGRWCNKPACRNHRILTLRNGNGISVGDSENYKAGFEFLHGMLTLGRIRCESCGLPDAIPGFEHPDGTVRTLCRGVGPGRNPTNLRLSRIAWPWLAALAGVEDLPARHDAPGGTLELAGLDDGGTSDTLEAD